MLGKSKKSFKTALVLGGGGARGIAHIGVLKVLRRENIPIDLVVGTSAGALFGGMFCQSGDIQAVEDKLKAFVKSDVYEHSGLKKVIKKQEDENFFGQLTARLKEKIVINMAHSREGLVKQHRIRNVIDFLLEEQDVMNTKIPFAAVAVDLVKGEETVFTDGDIRFAVIASSSLPGYFAPVESNGKLLADGAVLQVIPVPIAKKMGADFVIAVNVSQDLDKNPDLDNVVKIIFRASSITGHRYNQTLLQEADVVLRPKIGHLHWSEFDKFGEAIKTGEEVAETNLPVIKELLRKRQKKSFRLFR